MVSGNCIFRSEILQVKFFSGCSLLACETQKQSSVGVMESQGWFLDELSMPSIMSVSPTFPDAKK